MTSPRISIAAPRSIRVNPWTWILLAAGLLLLLFSPVIGSVDIPPATAELIVAHQLSGGVLPANPCGVGAVAAARCAAYTEIIWDARVPAILLALLVGAGLGVSGGTLQGVFRNPLADPYLLGISSGATLGAALLFVTRLGAANTNLLEPVFAFAGALATAAVILLAAQSRRATIETLVLTGVVLGTVLSGALLVILVYNPLGNLQVTFWLLGGLYGATWDRDGIVFAGVLIGSMFLVLQARGVNLLQLGPDVAQTLGLDPRRLQSRLVLATSLVTGIAVAFTGVIGFVGLVSPHIARRLVGVEYRRILPVAAAVGAGFLLLALDLSQVIIPHTELPVGVFTAFAGTPFFLYLLYRRHRSSTPGGE